MKTAVFLCNMGGPDSLENVEPFLVNIFKDPDIFNIPLPGFLRTSFVKWFAAKRAPESKNIYRQLGGQTPLTEIAEKQAGLLTQYLSKEEGHSYKVYAAMRYWHPLISDMWYQAIKDGAERIIIFSLYPFYSLSTFTSIARLVKKLINKTGFAKENVHFIDRFGSHDPFITAMAEQIESIVEEQPDDGEQPVILCSAHSVPAKRINNGDPYRDEVEAGFNKLKKVLPDHYPLYLSYQSKIGPVKWLEPSTGDMIKMLAAEGHKKLIVYPFGFVADNSETVYEIGMLYKELAMESGFRKYIRIDALNTDKRFIKMIKNIIIRL